MRHQFISEEQFKVIENRVRRDAQGNGERGHGIRVTNHSVGDPSPKPALSPYRSKWEAAYASKLELEQRAGLICQYWYEPFSLWLPGKVRYKPDFLVSYFPTSHTPNRPGFVTTLELVEVKGWSKNRRDGMTRLKIAAALFPCFVWRMVHRTKGGGWDGEYV